MDADAEASLLTLSMAGSEPNELVSLQPFLPPTVDKNLALGDGGTSNSAGVSISSSVASMMVSVFAGSSRRQIGQVSLQRLANMSQQYSQRECRHGVCELVFAKHTQHSNSSVASGLLLPTLAPGDSSATVRWPFLASPKGM